MNSLFASLLFSLVALCASTSFDRPNRDFDMWWNARKGRRLPLPFDLPRKYPPMYPQRYPPYFDGSSDETTTTKKPETTTIVLYKLNCDPCMPGWGVKSLCNETSDTVCRPCPLGTWSPRTHHYRQCMTCSKCGIGLYEDLTCTSSRDTKCDACSNPKAKINGDFIRKCDWRKVVDMPDSLRQAIEDSEEDNFHVEVFDLKSKELLDQYVEKMADSSPEFGSDEADLDRLIADSEFNNPEKDITVDDPEIDNDLPPAKKPVEAEENVSKDEEEEWARVMSLRRKASDEIAETSRRMEKERLEAQAREEDQLDDDEDTVQEEPRRLLLHPIRPLPQMMPAPERTIHVEPEDELEPVKENNFPPSYNAYPIDSLAHAGENQRRKAIVLLVLTCVIVVSTIAFIGCYVREYCRRRASYNRVVVVNLSPEEREIVRQSAHVLEGMDRPVKKFRVGGGGYSAIVDRSLDNCEAPVYVTENPLEEYLNSTDERRVADETLVDNEVSEHPSYARA